MIEKGEHSKSDDSNSQMPSGNVPDMLLPVKLNKVVVLFGFRSMSTASLPTSSGSDPVKALKERSR